MIEYDMYVMYAMCDIISSDLFYTAIRRKHLTISDIWGFMQLAPKDIPCFNFSFVTWHHQIRLFTGGLGLGIQYIIYIYINVSLGLGVPKSSPKCPSPSELGALETLQSSCLWRCMKRRRSSVKHGSESCESKLFLQWLDTTFDHNASKWI